MVGLCSVGVQPNRLKHNVSLIPELLLHRLNEFFLVHARDFLDLLAVDQ
jgi:hypothetical protein